MDLTYIQEIEALQPDSKCEAHFQHGAEKSRASIAQGKLPQRAFLKARLMMPLVRGDKELA